MNTNGHREKPQTDRERGVAENEKANYSNFPQEESKNEDEKDDIKETDQLDERDKEGGDIAGNAAGNVPPNEDED
ncbi:hypothetical protein [Sphingobacterium gobiense]|uniref:Uncharacterized protein n=1 Tax=Sphingobacterium gobiense TaxID=1382456 RepID=A0A2S9JTZ6_9SPHI|nr:hypothetical protein [Sphingobacterium gobiense]PRD56621.1 hypothetical protein C5749_05140 [Sphingobacterium gobiense]